MRDTINYARMARKIFKRFLPDPHRMREHRHLRRFGPWLRDPNIWHINRASLSGGLAAGLFVAMLPLPAHMLIAAAVAILLRVNLPISVASVWVSNPLTMAPLFFFQYKLGAWIMREGVRGDVAFVNPQAHFEPTLAWLTSEFSKIWAPLLLGSLIAAVVAAMLGYFGMQWLWRLHVVREWEKRRVARGVNSDRA
jgi:uncharacterized protein (DUF2062 family)